MRDDDVKELHRFSSELQRETDRGAAIVGASFIDARLGQTIEAFLCDASSAKKLLFDVNSPLSSLSARIDAAMGMALIDEFEAQECHLIRKVRNEFAHRLHGISFSDAKISKLCQNLKSDFPSGTERTSRLLFINSVISMTLSLFYRPEFVAQQKLKKKVWLDRDKHRWREIDKEPVPDGEKAMLFGKTKRRRPAS